MISATNKNLDELVNENVFREDLFYRINTLTITVPPLRERKEDLPEMIGFFCSEDPNRTKKADSCN